MAKDLMDHLEAAADRWNDKMERRTEQVCDTLGIERDSSAGGIVEAGVCMTSAASSAVGIVSRAWRLF